MFFRNARLLLSSACVLTLLLGCKTPPSRPGAAEKRKGDEIVVAGQFFHTGTKIVLWMDPGGYDAYRVERRFAPIDKADWRTSSQEVPDLRQPNRYGMYRRGNPDGRLTPEEIERIRGGGWDLPLLQQVVDQFVVHFDVCGVSRECFRILQDHRDLSVHFMLDLDGTIYQTLDLKERAWHATIANDRSVGIEIANMGAYKSDEAKALDDWYEKDANGKVRVTIPTKLGDGGIRTKDFVGRPARNELIQGNIQGDDLYQYDFTPQQYEALIHLTAALSKVFPKIACDFPHDAQGKVIPHKLPDDELAAYHGVLGHYHVQTNKNDPGPAFQWDYVIDHARMLLHGGMSPAADETSRGHMAR